MEGPSTIAGEPVPPRLIPVNGFQIGSGLSNMWHKAQFACVYIEPNIWVEQRNPAQKRANASHVTTP